MLDMTKASLLIKWSGMVSMSAPSNSASMREVALEILPPEFSSLDIE